MPDRKLHHWQAVKRILRYLAGTITHGLLLRHNSTTSLIGFADADWGADVDDRKSTTGYCIYMGYNLISWSSHKQKTVSISSTEAGYRAVAALLAEIVWIQSLLSELRIQVSKPKLYSNNLGVVLLNTNPVMHSKTKYFELDLHFVRDQVQKQKIQLLHLPARFQVNDPLTKPVSGILFLHVRDKLMIIANPTMHLGGGGLLRVPMCYLVYKLLLYQHTIIYISLYQNL